jgi:hypothetical protein
VEVRSAIADKADKMEEVVDDDNNEAEDKVLGDDRVDGLEVLMRMLEEYLRVFCVMHALC